MKKHIAIILGVLFFIIICVACNGGRVKEISEIEDLETKADNGKGKVGVLLPNKTEERWEQDAENITKALNAYGYQVHVEFAINNNHKQKIQMEGMLEEGVDCLVVSAVSSTGLKQQLEQARAQAVPVIAYDRLLMDTDIVSYYASFDNEKVGISIGTYIKEKEELDKLREQGKSKTIEFFMGSSDDNNAILVYKGIMQVLEEYLKDKTLVCKSKKTEFENTSINKWSSYIAEKNAVSTLRSSYKTEHVDIMCCASDGIASGVIAALEQEGYTEENWPLITGQDAGVEAVRYIVAGKQAMSVYKDTRLLADKCVTMVRAELEGIKPEINNESSYDNGVFKVPSYLCTGIVVDKENYQEILLDSKYYEMEQEE